MCVCVYKVVCMVVNSMYTLSHQAHTTHCKSLQVTAHTASHCKSLHHAFPLSIHPFPCLSLGQSHPLILFWSLLLSSAHSLLFLGHARILQLAATHCNSLQYTATHCNTLQHSATLCNTLQHTARHCTSLQHTATHCYTHVCMYTYICG